MGIIDSRQGDDDELLLVTPRSDGYGSVTRRLLTYSSSFRPRAVVTTDFDPLASGDYVLVIAAVAITSVIVTLVCMLANSRRTRRSQTRLQASSASRTGPTMVVVDRAPSTLPNLPPTLPPIYTTDTQGPKYFDAPPSYDEAVNTPVHSPVSPIPPAALVAPQVAAAQVGQPRRPDSQERRGSQMTEIELT
ncbi:unnamed protein product, partial [Mesorhabditis spiculigera]